jgi:hypothetical protein
MSAFDLYIYSIGAFAIVASILMRWPKARDSHEHKPSLAAHHTKK